MSYFRSCCTPHPQPGTFYRQARRYSTNALVDLWMQVGLIPPPGADFVFFSYDLGFCCKISYLDSPFQTPGRLAALWQGLPSAQAISVACAGAAPGCPDRATLPDCLTVAITDDLAATITFNVAKQMGGPYYEGTSGNGVVSAAITCTNGTYQTVVAFTDGRSSQAFTSPANTSVPAASGWSGPAGWSLAISTCSQGDPEACNTAIILNRLATEESVLISDCSIRQIFGQYPDGPTRPDAFQDPNTPIYRFLDIYQFSITGQTPGALGTCPCDDDPDARVWSVRRTTTIPPQP